MVNKLFIGNVPTDITEAEITKEFSMFGDLENIWVSRGVEFAFVEFTHKDDAEAACKNLNGKNIWGKELRVQRSHQQTPIIKTPGGRPEGHSGFRPPFRGHFPRGGRGDHFGGRGRGDYFEGPPMRRPGGFSSRPPPPADVDDVVDSLVSVANRDPDAALKAAAATILALSERRRGDSDFDGPGPMRRGRDSFDRHRPYDRYSSRGRGGPLGGPMARGRGGYGRGGYDRYYDERY